METDDELTIERSAARLGVHPFSLLTRIQQDRIEAGRARSGELLIPATELERLCPDAVVTNGGDPVGKDLPLSDDRMGIKRTQSGLKRNGEYPIRFAVPGYEGLLAEGEIKSYRAAFGAIGRELTSASQLRDQLEEEGRGVTQGPGREVNTPEIGRWAVRDKLSELGQSEVLLCRGAEGDFAVIEQFRPGSAYAKSHGKAEVLLQGDDPTQLKQDFVANARHTLAFMASNLTAKAQGIVLEQFPDNRPGQVVAAISDRCRLAVASEQTISQSQKHGHSVSRGIRM